jgi:hypothetical protein
MSRPRDYKCAPLCRYKRVLFENGRDNSILLIDNFWTTCKRNCYFRPYGSRYSKSVSWRGLGRASIPVKERTNESSVKGRGEERTWVVLALRWSCTNMRQKLVTSILRVASLSNRSRVQTTLLDASRLVAYREELEKASRNVLAGAFRTCVAFRSRYKQLNWTVESSVIITLSGRQK